MIPNGEQALNSRYAAGSWVQTLGETSPEGISDGSEPVLCDAGHVFSRLF